MSADWTRRPEGGGRSAVKLIRAIALRCGRAPARLLLVPITLYLDPAQEDDIIEALGNYLPFEHRERDFTERMSSRFRF